MSAPLHFFIFLCVPYTPYNVQCTLECIDYDFFEKMDNADPVMSASFNSTVRHISKRQFSFTDLATI